MLQYLHIVTAKQIADIRIMIVVIIKSEREQKWANNIGSVVEGGGTLTLKMHYDNNNNVHWNKLWWCAKGTKKKVGVQVNDDNFFCCYY